MLADHKSHRRVRGGEGMIDQSAPIVGQNSRGGLADSLKSPESPTSLGILPGSHLCIPDLLLIVAY